MYKLKDIITSGGSNAKINKSINRYILSKKEKKDIIKNIKNNSQNNDSSTLTKGKKILSEYYYINAKKLQEDLFSGIISNDFARFLEMYGNTDLDSEQRQIPVRIGTEEFGLSEIDHTIYKITFNNTAIYYEDNLPLYSEEYDAHQMAIRKYCKVYPPFDSASNYSTPNIYISINELFDATKAFSVSFDEMIAPYLITEEEFWAEAKLINDINEIS